MRSSKCAPKCAPTPRENCSIPQKCSKPLEQNNLTKFCRQNELGREREDACYINQREHDSTKPYALTVWSYRPYPSNKLQATCYPGQFYWDGHVGACNVDEESKVSRFPGFEMTKDKDHHQLPMYPIQLPQVKGWFDADTSSNLRYEYSGKKCSKASVTEKSYIPVTYQVFDSLCYDPQDPKYIIPEDSFNGCFTGAKFFHFGGEDTRHDRQERYRNACNWEPKNFPANLSYSNFGY